MVKRTTKETITEYDENGKIKTVTTTETTEEDDEAWRRDYYKPQWIVPEYAPTITTSPAPITASTPNTVSTTLYYASDTKPMEDA